MPEIYTYRQLTFHETVGGLETVNVAALSIGKTPEDRAKQEAETEAFLRHLSTSTAVELKDALQAMESHHHIRSSLIPAAQRVLSQNNNGSTDETMADVRAVLLHLYFQLRTAGMHRLLASCFNADRVESGTGADS
jgi:hypothetical protein